MQSKRNSRSRSESFPFDQIYKAMCGNRATIRDLLGNYLAQPRGPLSSTTLRALDALRAWDVGTQVAN